MSGYTTYATFVFFWGLLSIVIPTSIGCIEQDRNACNTTISDLISSTTAAFVFAWMFIFYWIMLFKLFVLISNDKETKRLANLGYFTCLLGVLFGCLQTAGKTTHYVLAGSLFSCMFVVYWYILYKIEKHQEKKHKNKYIIAMLILIVAFVGMIVLFITSDSHVYIFEWIFVSLMFVYPLLFHRDFYTEIDTCAKIECVNENGGGVSPPPKKYTRQTLKF